MKSWFLFFCALLLLVCSRKNLYAQQGVLSAGGDAVGSKGSVSFSIGQVAFTTLNNLDGTITEGVQQPYEIILNGIYDEPWISLECVIYPNPASAFVMLKIDNHEIKNLSYCLYNMNGLVIQENVINGKMTTIPMNDLVSGTYLLTVLENSTEVTFFKIIKK